MHWAQRPENAEKLAAAHVKARRTLKNSKKIKKAKTRTPAVHPTVYRMALLGAPIRLKELDAERKALIALFPGIDK